MPKKTSRTSLSRRVKKPSNLTRGKIIAYHEDDKHNREISRILKVPESTIRSIIKVYKQTGDIKRREGSGRKRKTTKRTDNAIVRTSKKDPFMPSREIRDNINLDHGSNISHQTVIRRLKEANLAGCVARKKPFISKINMKKRLEWAIDHKDWSVDDWKRVLWCDESPFTLAYHGRQFVWRPKGKAYMSRYIKPSFKHGGGNIQVWGCFSWSGVGDLYKINDTLVSVFVCIEPKIIYF